MRTSNISDETLRAIQNELGENPSERVAVIMSVVTLDRRLESLLRHFFTVTSGATKTEIDFFLTQHPCPPLGSAGLRVRLARCLNLIDRDTAKVLQHIIKCRNDFAHEIKPSISLASVVRKLIACCPRLFRKDMEKQTKEFSTAVWKFVVICLMLEAFLTSLELFCCEGTAATLGEVARIFAEHGDDEDAKKLKFLAEKTLVWDHQKYQRRILDFNTD